jgi:hypothetical protein
MRWILIVLLAVPAVTVADAYVALPTDTSQALYFPNVEAVLCYSTLQNNELVGIETDRCWPKSLLTIVVQGYVVLMTRPIEQLLKSCEPLNCELRAMPEN